MQLYNSLTKKKEEFVPVREGEVSIYVCGLTVYDYFHLGNARPFIVFDALRKFFEYKGFKVKIVINLTDVDDKILKKAEEEKIEPSGVSAKYIDAYFEDIKKLKVEEPTFSPKATEYIDGMIELVKNLQKNGYAYEKDGDVFFEVEKFADYGKFSGKNINELQSGIRIEVDERKKNPLDFALWKANKGESLWWDSPWGRGRPGWHLECSVMSVKLLGKEFDIHAGGEDLIFPHHENEIAQSKCGYGGDFAKYWMHNGFLRLKETKMSKSLGNVFTAREVLLNFSAEAIRLFFFQKHYRNPIDYEPELLADAEKAVDRLNRTYLNMKNLIGDFEPAQGYSSAEIDILKKEINEFLDDDFDTPAAIGKWFELNKIANSELETGAHPEILFKILNLYDELNSIFGLLKDKKSDSSNEDKLLDLILEIRSEIRKEKMWSLSDKIRDDLQKLGIVIEDGKEGSRWRRE